jgi:hypothetical protein
METFILYTILFILSMIGTNMVLTKSNQISISSRICPQKESFLKLIESGNHNEKLLRTIKEYSLIKIQNGHYEYDDVLKSLTHVGNGYDEKSKRKN